MGSYFQVVDVTPTITAGAYSAADAVGGLLEFENVCTSYSNSGELVKAIVTDKAKQNALLHLALFSRAFTPTADNAPFAVSDADLANLISVIHFEVADYASFDANSAALIGFDALAVSMPYVLVPGGTSLFGQLYTGGTPTYVATNDLTIKLIVRR
jgi:hypothetical protein